MSSWFGGPPTHSNSHSHHKHVSSSHRRSPSPKRYFVRSHSPSASTYATSHPNASTSRGFFVGRSSTFDGRERHSSSSSYYKRRPRDGYISRLIYQVKRYIRHLVEYCKRNPMKMFMLVIVPLVTGGALHNVLRSMGVRLPAGLAGVMGGNAGRHGEGFGGFEGKGGGGGLDLGQLMGVAKMFM